MLKKLKIPIIIIVLFSLGIFLQLNAYNKLKVMEVRYLEQLSNQNETQILTFNNKDLFKYSDLSRKYRKQISKEEFENISDIREAQMIFNKIDIKYKANQILSKRISGPVVANRGIIGDKDYIVENTITLAIEYFKPVVINWEIRVNYSPL